MAVDILTLNRKQKAKSLLNTNEDTTNVDILNPGITTTIQSPIQAQRNNLNRQVEIGVGTRIDPLSDSQKREYARSLTDAQWQQMQQYKKEGYGFEASKTLLENQNRLLDPTAQGIAKYKDYAQKEQYYNSGYDVDPDSALGKTAKFLEKIGFANGGNPITTLANNYNERYANYLNSYTEEGDKAPWLARVPLSAISGILTSAGKVSDSAGGLMNKADASLMAGLDRAVLGFDTDSSYYDRTGRSTADLVWEGVSGGLSGGFWVMAPSVMATFTAIGETGLGGKVLGAGDDLLRGAVSGIVKNTPGIKSHYNSLDEQGKEDMIDSLVTGATIGLLKGAGKAGKRAKNNTSAGKWLTQQEGYLRNLRGLFKDSLEKGYEEGKFQATVENVNKATAEPVFENGKQVGSRGAFGDTKGATGRVIQAGIDAFKKNFQEGLEKSKANRRQITPVTGDIPAGESVDPTVGGGIPSATKGTSGGIVGKVKDVAKNTWDDMVTGLSPEERIRIQNDPYVQEKFNKGIRMIQDSGMPLEDTFITEQLYNEIGDKILKTFSDIESQLNETSPVYKDIRNLNTRYSMIESLPEVNKLLTSNDIIITPDGLNFSNSKFVSDADMRSVQRALDMITNAITKPLTPREYLNLRTKLSELASYATVDASRAQKVIRQMRHAVDQVAKKQIPGLKELDKVTKTRLDEIKELKDGWVYKGGDRKGQVRNNFYSIIKNLTGENRRVMLERLKKYYPGVEEEIEAIHLTSKLLKAYNKAPQMVRTMGVGGGFAGGTSGNIFKAFIGAIVGEMAQEGLIRPWTKSFRKKAIEKLISQMSPEAKAKLEEIARKQTYAKELSKEDQEVLQRVTDMIQRERERGLKEDALRRWEQQQKDLNRPALPGAEPDVINEQGTTTLARSKGITPKQYNIPRDITEINLARPEEVGPKEAQVIQDALDVTPTVAEDIQDSVQDFLTEIGADKGTIQPSEVNYEKFSTESLNELYQSDIPVVEKTKIEEILSNRPPEELSNKDDQYYAYKIRQIEEAEQRIGKVGKNKVGSEYKKEQLAEWESKKERIIEELGEKFNLDANGAVEKYNELRDKPVEFIDEYKRSARFIDEQAEQIVLDRLISEWSKQPKFIREMTQEQLNKREDFLNSLNLKEGFQIDNTPYNDRYQKIENGQVVASGAIKYLPDGNIEIATKDINGFLDSGIINSLPDEAILRVTGTEEPTTIAEIRYGDVNPENLRSVYHGTSVPDIEKFDTNFIGSGEGTNVHGAGIYLSVEPGVARRYAKNVASMKVGDNERKPVTYKGQEVAPHRGRDHVQMRKYVGDNFDYESGNNEVNEFIEYVVSKRGWKDRYDAIDEVEFENRKDEFIEKIYKKIDQKNNRLANDTWRVAEQFREKDIERAKTMIKGYEKAIDRILNEIKYEDFEFPSEEEVTRNFYTVEIPEKVKANTPTGSNYLEESDFVSSDVADEFTKKVLESGLEVKDGSNPMGIEMLMNSYKGGPDNKINVKNLYHVLQVALGSDKNASDFLNKMGYDGIHYYGARDGECYVIFNGDSIKIIDVEQFSKGSHSSSSTSEPFEYISEKQYKKVDDMGINDIREGLKLYQDAEYDMEARREFVIQKQQPGYIEKLGLNKEEVNQKIKERADYKEGVKELSNELNKGVNIANQFLGLQNISLKPRLASNISALKSLTKKVKGAEDGAYIPYMVDAILAFNSDISYKLLTVIAEDAGKNINGLYRPAYDELKIGEQYQQTASHETTHYLDFLRGREIFGGSYYAPKYLTNPGLQITGLPKAHVEFYYKFRDFITKLEQRPSIISKIKDFIRKTRGKKNYRTTREEIFARFGEAFIDRIKKTAKDGVTQKDFNKQGTDAWDVFTLEDFKEFINLIQMKSKLTGLKEAQTPMEEFKTGLGKGYENDNFQIQQPSLFDTNPNTYQDIIDDIYVRLPVYNLMRAYDVNPINFRDKIEGKTTGNHLHTLSKIYKYMEELKPLAKDNQMMDYLKESINSKNDEIRIKAEGLYKLLSYIQNKPVDFTGTALEGRTPDEINFMDLVAETESLSLGKSYDPDVLERYSNLKKDASTLGIDIEILNKIKDAGQKLIDQGIDEIKSSYFVTPYNDILKSIKERGNENMFEKKTYTKVAKEAENVIRSAIRDVEMLNDNYDLMNGERKDGFEGTEMMIHFEVTDALGYSYDPDIEKRQKNFAKEVKDIIKEHEGFEGVKRYKDIVNSQRFTNLLSKVNELIGKDPSLAGIDHVERFMEAVNEKNAELVAKGEDKAVRKLVAQSGMSVENFRKQMENFGGKSPMPSIAVGDPNIEHSAFGDLTLIFGKDTIDPKANEANKLYASDAWTPMFPHIEEIIDTVDTEELTRKLYLEGDIGKNHEFTYDPDLKTKPENITGYLVGSLDYLFRHINPKNRVEGQKTLDRIKEQYDLSEKGYNLIKDAFFTRRTKEVIPAAYFNKPGTIEEMIDTIYTNGVTDFDYYAKDNLGDNLKSLMKTIVEEHQGEGAEKVIEELHGLKYFNADDPDVQTAVKDFVYGTNDRPVTPDNIVEAMKNQGNRRDVEEGSFRDMIEIEGHKVEDIEDVRRQNFAKVSHGDWTGDIGNLERRYDAIIDAVVKETMKDESMEANQANSYNMKSDLMYEIKNNYSPDLKTFEENLKENVPYWYEHLNDYMIQRIIDIVEQGKKVPIRFSESKPERVVDLYKEVQYILAPQSKLSLVKKIVQGTPLENKVFSYNDNDVSIPRVRKMKELEKKYGNVFFSMGGMVMPIAMLLMMVEKITGDDTD